MILRQRIHSQVEHEYQLEVAGGMAVQLKPGSARNPETLATLPTSSSRRRNMMSATNSQIEVVTTYSCVCSLSCAGPGMHGEQGPNHDFGG